MMLQFLMKAETFSGVTSGQPEQLLTELTSQLALLAAYLHMRHAAVVPNPLCWPMGAYHVNTVQRPCPSGAHAWAPHCHNGTSTLASESKYCSSAQTLRCIQVQTCA
jgi:hypothetical protein